MKLCIKVKFLWIPLPNKWVLKRKNFVLKLSPVFFSDERKQENE